MSTRTLIRRSVLVVAMEDAAAVEAAAAHDADVVVLEPADLLASGDLATARALASAAITAAARGGAEVFLRLRPEVATAEITASVHRSLTGYVVPVRASAAEVKSTARTVKRAEKSHGVPAGQVELFPLLVTASAIWNVREIVTASKRVRSVALDEAALAADLGIVPREDFDPFAYARGRLVVESIAAGRQPLGIGHPLSLMPRAVSSDELTAFATTARNTGFKGSFCTNPEWVRPLNAAFSPTAEQVAYYREVRKAFAAGIARGTAAVPYEGRMIDVPVDERARLMIHLWEESQRRDTEKAEARVAAGLPAGFPA